MTSATPAQPRWTPPPRFDGFELVRPLGVGGMGLVYLARDTRLDRLVALKVVADDTCSAQLIERFTIEVRALARVQHPNVVVAYGAGMVDGHPYLTQELLVGARLDEVPRPLPWRRVLAIGRGLARAVAAVHACGIVHRDLKPSNVMLVGGHRVKLFDFGLALLPDHEEGGGEAAHALAAGSASSSTRLTGSGRIAGTPAYIAPELWNGEPATTRSDLYGFGLVLYELLADELPRHALHGYELAQAALHQDVPAIASRRADVPPRFAAVVERCVARDPARRPTSAAEVRDVLDAIAGAPDSPDRRWSIDGSDGGDGGDAGMVAMHQLESLPTDVIPIAKASP